MSRSYRTCPTPGCPELIAPGETQCAQGHGRPKNASWSRDRDRSTQRRERRAALARDDYTCQMCGRRDPTGATLDAHHGEHGQVIALCNSKAPAGSCHATVDRHAR